jgi:hypothetical protein
MAAHYWKANGRSTSLDISQTVEPKGLLPYAQEPSTDPYPQIHSVHPFPFQSFFLIRHFQQPFMSLSRLILEVPRSHTRTPYSR